MSEYKFHFKSPEQLQSELRDASQSQKKRNKILIIIFADLLVLAIIVILVYANGLLDQKELKLVKNVNIAQLEYSGSIILNENNEYIIFLNILNKNNESVLFPPANVDSFNIHFIDEYNHQLTRDFPLSSRTITSGETSIYRTQIKLNHTEKIKEIVILLEKNKQLVFHYNLSE